MLLLTILNFTWYIVLTITFSAAWINNYQITITINQYNEALPELIIFITFGILNLYLLKEILRSVKIKKKQPG